MPKLTFRRLTPAVTMPLLLLTRVAATQGAEKPNVVLVFMDNFGYGEFCV